MCLFARKRHKKADSFEMLPLERIAEIMFNKNLSFSDEVVDVIYSSNKAKRYVLLKPTKIFIRFYSKKLYVFDEDELQWMKTDSFHPDELLPAYWASHNNALSLFGTLEDAVNSMRFEPEYKRYFE